jgi:hypothetical protein
MYDTIAINKELVPCSFDIVLGGELFTMSVDYNETYGFFTVGLSKDDATVCNGEKIVYGKPLFEEIFENDKFPSIEIVPYDPSGEMKEVTFDNLSETVLLVINDQEKNILSGGE